MKKILYIYQPTKIYSDWVENKLARNKFKFLSRIFNYFNFRERAYYTSNPRTMEYCFKRAVELANQVENDGSELHCIALSDKSNETAASEFMRIQFIPEQVEFIEKIKNEIAKMDKIVLLYPDAIGQGFEKVESVLHDMDKVYIINGRRRVFRLTKATLKELKIRRIFEKYFILEIFTSLFLPVLFLPYYAYERLNRKSYKSPINQNKTRKRFDKYISNGRKGNEAQAESIAAYWSSRPQTYGIEDGKSHYADKNGKVNVVEIGGKDFFEKVDSTFYSWNRPIHTEEGGELVPFGKIFDYKALYRKKVLEIGCGMGTMAMNWAKRDAEIYAIDLNPVAIEQTRQRFQIYGIKGNIRNADARKLPFEDKTFSYVYSWGVLHHSPNIKKSIDEIYRVLKPGCKTGLMLYNRNSILFKYMVEYIEGFLHFENRFLSPVELASRYGDGGREEGNPYTYPLTRKEITNDLMKDFKTVRVRVFGTDIDWMLYFLCIPYHRSVPMFIKKSIARRFGWSLWIDAEKPLAEVNR